MNSSVLLTSRYFYIRSVEDVDRITLLGTRRINKKSHEYRICKIVGPDNARVIIDVPPFHASGIFSQEAGIDHFIPVTVNSSPILKEITDAIKAKVLPLLRERLSHDQSVDKISQSIISGDDDVMKNAFNKKDDDDDGEACWFVKFVENTCLFTFKENDFIAHERIISNTVLPCFGLYKFFVEPRFTFIGNHSGKSHVSSISYRAIQVVHYPIAMETAPQVLALSLDEFPTSTMGEIDHFLKSLTAVPDESGTAIAEIPAKQAKITDFLESEGPVVKQKKVKK